MTATVTAMIMTMATITPAATTTICARPMSMCWPMRRPRCWRWWRSGAGYLWGIAWLDPLVGIVGALVIGSWAYGLVRDSGLVLLDAEDDPALAAAISAT